ncbi:MAG: cob(I)yrinic acid a,c-diamide adenosyltransferase [Bacteroidetes bacterium]|nr:MAG: cob(I)yrinic acid a,c-diamide adenosyltransferase [Bacteroidota bacterium]
MKIYSKTGDKGKTSLLSGERVEKSDIRINAYGTIDELNSFIGFLNTLELSERHKIFLKEIQNKLFNLGSLLAVRKAVSFKIPEIKEDDILLLENEIDNLNKDIPSLKEFIIPGGDIVSAQCHICRSVCRRAERLVVEIGEKESVNNSVVKFLNRLSDYLFVLARKNTYEKHLSETVWKP